MRILAISRDPPEALARLKQTLQLPFTLLSDPTQRVVGSCGLSHCALLLDKDGVIRWGVLTENWQQRLPPTAVLQAALRLQREEPASGPTADARQ